MARPLFLLALSLLLHLIVLQLALFGSGGTSTEPAPTPVAVMLLAAPPAQKIAPKNEPIKETAKDVSRTATAKPPRVKQPALPAPVSTPPPASVFAAPPIQLPEVPSSPLQTQQIAEPDVDGPDQLDTTPAIENTDLLSPTVSTVAQTDIDLPPSAVLSYEVRYATRGSITLGTGTIDWQASQDGYAVEGEISKFGFTLSSFRSQGNIDRGGLAPALYFEKNARRAETITRFERNPEPDTSQTIFFSANAGTAPLIPGAQDRASILWQLAGLARATNASFISNGRLEILVAGVRDAEPWQIDVLGEEWIDIDIESGRQTRAWHLVRSPRPGTRDKRIDIWLAPDRQWYPVKLRYTEINGDYLDFSLDAIR
ncbi:MAG: DUF3108 domain-containing protein [Pseudomonadota bacterium]